MFNVEIVLLLIYSVHCFYEPYFLFEGTKVIYHPPAYMGACFMVYRCSHGHCYQPTIGPMGVQVSVSKAYKLCFDRSIGVSLQQYTTERASYCIYNKIIRRFEQSSLGHYM